MAVTRGHGNPDWTRDEVLLALALYFDCQGKMPSKDDPRVRELSQLLRSFPQHHVAARQPTFRNPDGVAFKLQNLRQVATGKGLGNVSRTDREVWNEFGNNPQLTRERAELIRRSIVAVDAAGDAVADDEVFVEGMVVTQSHMRRERDGRLRKRLIAHRRSLGPLCCDVCGFTAEGRTVDLQEASFEAHHVQPLAAAAGERTTRLRDLSLVCANCHRMIHRAIALQKRWLTMDDARWELIGRVAAK